jgi:hypothetical protein
MIEPAWLTRRKNERLVSDLADRANTSLGKINWKYIAPASKLTM